MSLVWLRAFIFVAIAARAISADLLSSQQYFSNFDGPLVDSYQSGTPIITWTSAPCSANVNLSGTGALNTSTSSNAFYFGPIDLNTGVAVTFSSFSCSFTSNLTLSYFKDGTWVDVTKVSPKAAPPTTFSSILVPGQDQSLPGSYLRLQLTASSSSIFVDDLAVDCLSLPCTASNRVALVNIS